MNPRLNKLREVRIKSNLTMKDMSIKLGISKSMYDYIELGVKRLSYDMAVKIAEIFKMSPDELFYSDFDNFYK